MRKDRKFVWVVEYVIGVGLLAAIMPSIVRPHPGWSEAHGWAYILFIACSGIVLVSSASAMRQRMKVEERVAKLERMLEGQSAQKQSHSEAGQKHTAEPRYAGVSSVN